MKRLFRRLKELLAGRIEQRVTRGGLAFSAAILFTGVAAFTSANNLLFLILAAMLATLLVSGFINRLTLSGLEVEFFLPEHLSARRRASARMVIRNSKRTMPSFSIHLAGDEESCLIRPLYWPVIAGSSFAEEHVEVFFEKRGRYNDNVFQISSRFPFGFAERRVSVTLRGEAIVYPCVDPQPDFQPIMEQLSGELEAQLRGRGYDFYRIRPYEYLESVRHVDWRATAHTGELQVREFAQEQELLLQLVLDLDVPLEMEDWFEHVIDCCAHLTHYISEHDARLRFRTQDFDMNIPEQADVYTILKYLALIERKPGCSLVAPDAETAITFIFTTRTAQTREAGWLDARMYGPAELRGSTTKPSAGPAAVGTR